MELLREVLDPAFLSRNSVYTGVLVGGICPLVGVYLMIRRLVFLGVALPQISSCGIAFAFALHTWHIVPHLEEGENALAFGGSACFTFGSLLVLAWLARRNDFAEGRIGAAYVLAGAWSILLLLKNPFGQHGLTQRLQGEIIAIADADLLLTTIALGLVAMVLIVFHKELLLVSFDAEMAVTLGKRLHLWNGVLFLVIGIAVSAAVLAVGPLITFGFLILPPLIARHFVRTMAQFSVVSSVIGAIAGFSGFLIAYRWDLPVGPTDVALLGGGYFVTVAGRRLFPARS
jgi:ABC-type Mn2+/Zn2+ transport system permease subunit